MKDFITKNFSVLLVAVLILFLWSKGMFKPAPALQPTIVVVSDTTDKQHTGTIITTPPIIQYVPYPVEKVTKEILSDSNYVKQIIADYLSKRIQKDTLHLPDTLGYVAVTDTVTSNRVVNRKWDFNIKERTITNTVTIKEPYKPKTQLYYGFEISSPLSDILGIQQLQAGLIIKNKKDNILKANIGYNFMTNSPIATLGYYPKFHF